MQTALQRITFPHSLGSPCRSRRLNRGFSGAEHRMRAEIHQYDEIPSAKRKIQDTSILHARAWMNRPAPAAMVKRLMACLCAAGVLAAEAAPARSDQVAQSGNDALASVIEIEGDAEIGGLLTAKTSFADDQYSAGKNGAPIEGGFAYQWIREDVDGNHQTEIPHAIDDSYLLGPDDWGNRIRVRVGLASELGVIETWISEAYPLSSTVEASGAGIFAASGVAAGSKAAALDVSSITDSFGLTVSDASFQTRRANFSDTSPNGGNAAASPNNAGEAAPSPSTGSPTLSRLTVADSSDVAEPAVGAAATMMFFTVTLTPVADRRVTVEYSFSGTATEGVDYEVPQNKMLVFPAGTTTAQIEVAVSGDIVAERGGETVVVSLLRPSGAFLGSPRRATGTIGEPDQIVVSARSPRASFSGESNQSTVSFDLRLDRDAPAAGAVDWRVVIDRPASMSASSSAPGARATVTCSGMSSPCEGTARFAAGSRTPADNQSAIFSDVIPAGSAITVQLKPFRASQGGRVASSVLPSTRLALNESEIVTGGWIVAVRSTVSAPRQTTVEHAVASFGHTVATGIVNSIWRRAEAHRGGGMETVANPNGKAVDTASFSDINAGRTVWEVAGLLGLKQSVSDDLHGRLDLAASRGNHSDSDIALTGVSDGSGLDGQTQFALAIDLGISGGPYTFWGDIGMSSRGAELGRGTAMDSVSTNFIVGADYPGSEDIVLGVALSQSSGEADYTDSLAVVDAGTVKTSLASLVPYIQAKRPSGLNVWSAAGFGWGALTHSESSGSVETGLSMWMVAAGARDDSWNLRLFSREMGIKGDFFMVSTKADAKEGAIRIREVDTTASRFRVATEVFNIQPLVRGPGMSYLAELGARMDGGAGASGLGADIAVDLIYSNPESGLSAALQADTLLFHSDSDYQEWSAGLRADYDPGPAGQGLIISLEPAWNASRLAVADGIWSDLGFGSKASVSAGASLKSRLAYGVKAMRDQALATLFGEAELDSGDRRLRLGAELRGLDVPFSGLSLDLYSQREESLTSSPRHAVMLEGSVGL